MNKKIILASLIKCANDLDDMGFTQAADDLTGIAGDIPHDFPESDEHLPNREHQMLQGDEYEELQRLLNELNGEEIDPSQEEAGFIKNLISGGADIASPVE
jgi:hypothetical protein